MILIYRNGSNAYNQPTIHKAPIGAVLSSKTRSEIEKLFVGSCYNNQYLSFEKYDDNDKMHVDDSKYVFELNLVKRCIYD